MNSKSREEWDLNHPDDQMPMRLGIDGQYIPERYIPFDSSSLETFDTIINEDAERLIYYKEDKSYKIYISSAYAFLPNPFKKWEKLEYPKTSDQSLSTTGDIKLGGDLVENTTLSKAEQIMYNVCMDKLERIIGEDFKLEISNPRTPEQMVQLWNLENEDSKMFCAKMSVEEIFNKYGDSLSKKQKEILKKHWEDASQAKRGNDMVINNKEYFTPSIEDIHVGYQLEYLFEGQIWQTAWVDGGGLSLSHCINLMKLQPDWLRVPYLTKEQIEKEGWKFKGRSIDLWWEKEGSFQIGNWTSYKIVMHYGMKGHVGNQDTRLFIYAEDQGSEHNLYEGQCRDINDFRKICKLIGI